MKEQEKIMQELIPLFHKLSEFSKSGNFDVGNGTVSFEFECPMSEWSEKLENT